MLAQKMNIVAIVPELEKYLVDLMKYHDAEAPDPYVPSEVLNQRKIRKTESLETLVCRDNFSTFRLH